MNIENKSINTLRALSLAMIDEANSGHPGIVLGAAPMLYTLFSKHLKFNPKYNRWINRDRFIMAAGHGSALYYSALHLFGYELSIDDLKSFRKVSSKTPGHPEFAHTAGVDATSGPLGQGIAMAVGMAVAEEYVRNKFNITNHYTFVLCGDGDLQEGVTQEAMSLAGNQKLGKLIVLYDSNDIQLDTPVNFVNTENVKAKYEAMNWQHILVEDGNSVEEIDNAISEAKKCFDKPTIIEVKTVIGYGSSKAGTSAIHGSPLGVEGSKNAMENLGYTCDRFEVSSDVYEHVNTIVENKVNSYYARWTEKMSKLQHEDFELYTKFDNFIKHNVNVDFEAIYDELKVDAKPDATRNIGGKVLDMIGAKNDYLLAGSADLSGSTKVKGLDGNFDPSNRLGRNINFGVREHAMSAMANGFVLHSSLDIVVAGFFVFSDYAKPAIRMASLMNIPTIFTFTHDSIAVGEDGPTHEPVEQLVGLRSIPNLDVFRPADLSEVVASYKMALNKQNPSSIVLTRQNLPVLENFTSMSKAEHGGYIVKSFANPDGIIIASGSELSLAIEVSKKLEESNIYYNVVSMLCMSIFNSQSAEYIENVLPTNLRRRVAIEMGSAYSWHQYVGLDGKIFSVDTFGMSGPAEEVMNKFGFDRDKIVFEIMKLMSKGVE